MSATRRPRVLPFLLCLVVASPAPMAGCSDESKQSGTQVHMSEEMKAQIDAKRGMYKDRASQNKAKTAKRR